MSDAPWTYEIVGGPLDGTQFPMDRAPRPTLNIPAIGVSSSQAAAYAIGDVIPCSFIRKIFYFDGRKIAQYQWPGLRTCRRSESDADFTDGG